MVSRSQAETDTRISGPIGMSVNATSTVTMTLANDGDVTLGRFADWDAIMEIQTSPGLKISYLSYTENASPGADQWTVKGIYLDNRQGDLQSSAVAVRRRVEEGAKSSAGRPVWA